MNLRDDLQEKSYGDTACQARMTAGGYWNQAWMDVLYSRCYHLSGIPCRHWSLFLGSVADGIASEILLRL